LGDRSRRPRQRAATGKRVTIRLATTIERGGRRCDDSTLHTNYFRSMYICIYIHVFFSLNVYFNQKTHGVIANAKLLLFLWSLGCTTLPAAGRKRRLQRSVRRGPVAARAKGCGGAATHTQHGESKRCSKGRAGAHGWRASYCERHFKLFLPTVYFFL
jgi:hypothetical protein